MVQSTPHDAQRLLTRLDQLGRVVVALSGGVDSSVVAAAAFRVRPDTSLAVTAVSPSVAQWQLDYARRIAAEIGIQHHVVTTDEGDREAYRRNDHRRCYYCKETLYAKLRQLCLDFSDAQIVSGTNADDLGDYRPGIQAGDEAGVATPLADLELGKSAVRRLANYFGLSNASLPASPCLASRIAYGLEVTPKRLKRIDQAEDWLRARGFNEFRVRLHPGELARLEVPKDEIPRLIALDANGQLTKQFQSLGFCFVTVDMEGFRSGGMNRVLVQLAVDPADRQGRVVKTSLPGEVAH